MFNSSWKIKSSHQFHTTCTEILSSACFSTEQFMTPFKHWDRTKSKVLVALYLLYIFIPRRAAKDKPKHIYHIIGLNIFYFLCWNNYRFQGRCKNSAEKSRVLFTQFPLKVASYTASDKTMWYNGKTRKLTLAWSTDLTQIFPVLYALLSGYVCVYHLCNFRLCHSCNHQHNKYIYICRTPPSPQRSFLLLLCTQPSPTFLSKTPHANSIPSITSGKH